MLSAMWSRCFSPERGSIDTREDANTYCHIHSRFAFGYLRASACGRCTLPNPSTKSCSCRDLGFRHFGRMTFVVEQNESSDPVTISLLGSDAVMFAPDHFANLIEQLRLVRGRRRA